MIRFSVNSVKVPWQPTKAGDLDLEVLALKGCEFKMLGGGEWNKQRQIQKTKADTQLALIGAEVQRASAIV